MLEVEPEITFGRERKSRMITSFVPKVPARTPFTRSRPNRNPSRIWFYVHDVNKDHTRLVTYSILHHDRLHAFTCFESATAGCFLFSTSSS